VMFAALLGALVSAGVALLFHGLRPLAGADGPMPGSGGPGMRSGLA